MKSKPYLVSKESAGEALVKAYHAKHLSLSKFNEVGELLDCVVTPEDVGAFLQLIEEAKFK